MLITLFHCNAIYQLVSEVQLTSVIPLGAVSKRFNCNNNDNDDDDDNNNNNNNNNNKKKKKNKVNISELENTILKI